MFAPLLSLAGSAVSAFGTIAAGNSQAAAADYEAKQARINASQEMASAQRRAEGEKIKTTRFISSQKAAAGADGGGADASVLNQIGKAQEEGSLRQATTIYEGKEAARQWENKAQASEFEGKMAKKAAMIGAGSSIIGGLGSWVKAYG